MWESLRPHPPPRVGLPAPDVTADAPAHLHAASVPEPGTPPGLGDPANPDTAGGTEESSED